MASINVIDLFAGCGGLTDGFEQAGGYHTLAGVEWELKFCEVLRTRLSTKWGYPDARETILHFDMQRVDELINGWQNDLKYGDGRGLSKIIGNKKVHLIVGGPPCQAYSMAGRVRDRNGMHDDYRNYLFESYVEIVKAYKPDAFIFENVLGMLSAKPGGVSITERISEAFKKAGYTIVDDLRNAVFDTSDYGVPQKRKRVVILGLRNERYKNPEVKLNRFYNEILPKHKIGSAQTVKDAIGNMPKFLPMLKPEKINGQNFSHSPFSSDIPNHNPRFHSLRDIKIFKILAKDVNNKLSEYKTAEDLKRLYTLTTGKESAVHKYYVLRWDKPSNTIPAHLYKDGLRHIHPDPNQARSITVREAARLQSFDDDFIFTGSAGDNYRMIGNAVPPIFAKILAESVKQIIKV